MQDHVDLVGLSSNGPAAMFYCLKWDRDREN